MSEINGSRIVKQETPEERELAKLLLEIESRKEVAAELQAESESLKQSLSRFEAEYHARIGPLFVELDRLRLSLDVYECRIQLLQANSKLTKEDIEARISEEFETRSERIEDDEERVYHYEEVFRQESKRPEFTDEASNDLKQIYRDLAKRFHPDLARTDEERFRRQTVMQEINDAYQARNFDLLRQIERRHEFIDPCFERRSIGEKLVWAIREISRLDDVIASIRSEIGVIRETKTYELWRRRELGEDVLTDLENALKSDADKAAERLSKLYERYRQIANA